MYSDDQTELTAEERTMLAALSREIRPGDLLEERVVRALRRDGYLGGAVPAGRRGLSAALKIAAALALFAGGVATGRYLVIPDAPRSASLTVPAGVIGKDTIPSGSESIPVRGQVVAAETELWL